MQQVTGPFAMHSSLFQTSVNDIFISIYSTANDICPLKSFLYLDISKKYMRNTFISIYRTVTDMCAIK